MQDPMANLTGDAPGGGQDPAGGASMGMANGKQVFDPIALQINMQRIERIRAVMGIASGCVAGIIGLTGLEGLVCFLSLHLFVAIAVWGWKMDFDLEGYTKQSWPKYLATSLQPTALSFTLFWTLFYGLVYLY